MPQLIFEYVVGGPLGDYQTYVDVSDTETVNLRPPKDYAILGAKLYRDLEDIPGRRVHHNTLKSNDQVVLSGYGRTDQGRWQSMFAGNPGFGGNTGISFTVNNDDTATIQDSNPAGQGPDRGPKAYQYLIWIQANAALGNVYDFIDPGIRNRGP